MYQFKMIDADIALTVSKIITHLSIRYNCTKTTAMHILEREIFSVYSSLSSSPFFASHRRAKIVFVAIIADFVVIVVIVDFIGDFVVYIIVAFVVVIVVVIIIVVIVVDGFVVDAKSKCPQLRLLEIPSKTRRRDDEE